MKIMTTSINDYSYRTWENTNTNNVSKSSKESSDTASTAKAGGNISWWRKTFDKAKESVKNMVGQGKAFMENHPNLAKAGKILKLANPVSVVLNVFSGYNHGEEVAEEYYNGNAEHDAQVYNGSTTGGAYGAVAGGALGAAAGAAVGSIIPVAGTAVGAGVGFVFGCIGGAIGSYLGGSAGAHIGANSAENHYNNEQYNEINSHRPSNASIPGFFSGRW